VFLTYDAVAIAVKQRDCLVPISPRQMGVLEANNRRCEAIEVEGPQELQVVALCIDLEKIDALDADEDVFERHAVDGNSPDLASPRILVSVALMPVLEVVPREGSEAGQGRDWIAGVVLDYEQRARTALHVDGGIDEGEALQPLVVRDESLEGLRLRLDQDAMPPAVDDVLVQPVKGNTVERSDLNEEELCRGSRRAR
jgi:hypothetical protein